MSKPINIKRGTTQTLTITLPIATGGKPFLDVTEIREIEDRNNTTEILSRLEGGNNGTTTP